MEEYKRREPFFTYHLGLSIRHPDDEEGRYALNLTLPLNTSYCVAQGAIAKGMIVEIVETQKVEDKY